MQTVILCGGEGTRYRHYADNAPKVLARIGTRPILWHIMKYYQSFGHNKFILCLGNFKEEVIAEISAVNEDWEVIFADTGLDTPTGGRVKLIEEHIANDNFYVTYGDGLSDVPLNELLSFHLSHEKVATLTSFRPYNQYGVVEADDSGVVKSFQEKPRMTHYVNGGFFVFRKSIFQYLDLDKTIETSLFTKLVEKKELMSFKHNGFWKSMDTFKENQELNEIWEADKAAWKRW